MICSRDLAMLFTTPGAAAIAVIRLTGPHVPEFLSRHFSKLVPIGRCIHGNITDEQRVIDDAVVARCDELTADLNVHGGQWVVRSVMDLARREGFEILEGRDQPLPLEMMDGSTQLEREIQSHLPLIRTELGLRVLLAQEQAWKDLKSRAKSSTVGAELQEILADRTLEHLLYPPGVAIVGPPNAGKSTLANQLFAQERSITADVPGTTRDWVGEIANIDGLPVLLMDTPGLRTTSDEIESQAIEQSRRPIEAAKLIVLVLDATRPIGGEQSMLLQKFFGALTVMNKVDLPLALGMDHVQGLGTVAKTGQNVDQVRRRIVQFFCGSDDVLIDRPRIWTPRQRSIIENAMNNPAALTVF